MNLPVGDHDQGTTEEPPSEYIVVLRAPSAARFKEDEGVALSLDDKAFNSPIQVKLRTRWVDEGFESRIPRELWIELGISAISLDEACSAASSVAHLLSVIATFCANVTGHVPEVHLAYRRKPKDGRREFIEVFLPDETTSPREGRSIETTEYVRLVEALWSSPEQRRIIRALNQYEVALRYWYLGGEWLSLAHLYMAVEALTKTSIRHECRRLGITEEELAHRNGIDPDDPERPRWRPALDAWARLRLIFGGDDSVYSAAKDASDGIEHGYMEFSEIHQKAIAATLSTFSYVRLAVLRFLGMSEDSDLALREPLDVGSLRKMVRGHFVGDSEDPAPAGSEYPHLAWNSTTKVFRRSGDRFLYTPEEKITVQCADGVGFIGTSFEVRGRLQSGGFEMLDEAPVELSAGPQRRAGAELFDSARQLIERVRAALTLPAIPIPRSLRIVFHTLAEHVAVFEAVALLVEARRPVEALLLVNVGIQCACRLQLMADAASGAAWIARAGRDSATGASIFANDEAGELAVRQRLAELQRLATEQGIELPDGPWPLDTTAYWTENAEDIQFVSEVSRADELAASLHTVATESKVELRTEVDDLELATSVLLVAMTSVLASSDAASAILDLPVDHSELRSDIESLNEQHQA